MAKAKQRKSPQAGAGTGKGSFLSGDGDWGILRLVLLGGLGLILLLVSLFVPGFGRYLIAPIFASILTFLAGMRYIQDIYELENLRDAFHYIFASFFGLPYPHITISKGKKNLKKEDANLLDIIGGPGYVYVQPGNAVLFEGQAAPTAIHADGTHFVPRFERIQPIALEDQYGELAGISAMTRDGLMVGVGITRFRFRLLANREASLRNNPYPYDNEAIYDMIYHRTVSEDGLADWTSGVATDIRKVITSYINKNTLDNLTAPDHRKILDQTTPSEEPPRDPRGEIKANLFSAEIAGKLRRRGTELLSVDIGNFEISNKDVEKQRLNTWQAKWMGDARLNRSFGEAQHLAYQEIGRSEAQAEILIGIIHALSDFDLHGGSRQDLRNMILVQTAQLIEAMGEAQNKGSNQLPRPEETKKEIK